MKIFLKGNNALPDFGEVDSTNLVDLKDAEITLRKKTGENFASSFSKDLVFSGAAFKYLKTHLVLAENARTNVIILEVYDDCCYPEKQIFRGKITANSIDYCFRDDYKDTSCLITASAEELDEIAGIRKSLISKNNKWSDGVYFWERVHNQIPYCEEIRPVSMHYFRFFLSLCITQMFFAFFPILVVISAIIAVVNVLTSLFGGKKLTWDDITGPFNDMRVYFFEDMPRWGIGCGYYHYAVSVTDYINNAIQGYDKTINFSSEILNNPSSIYYNTILLHCPTHEGELNFFLNANTIDNNLVNNYFTRDSPNWTLGELLDRLAPVFNAEWYIENKTIHFENKKNLDSPDFWIDLENTDQTKIKKLCFKWVDAPNYLGARFKYQNDGFDACSDEANYLYSDIVQFNPLNNSQDKLLDVQLQFAPARFRGDGLAPDPVDSFKTIFYIYSLVGLSGMDFNFDKNLLLSSGKVSVSKLLIPEQNYRREHLIVINKNGAEGFNFNYPYWFDAAHPLYNPAGYYDNPPNSKKRREAENLFQFYQNLDPHKNAEDLLKIGQSFELEIDRDCELYNKMFDKQNKLKNSLKIRMLIDNTVRIGTVEEVTISDDMFKINGVL